MRSLEYTEYTNIPGETCQQVPGQTCGTYGLSYTPTLQGTIKQRREPKPNTGIHGGTACDASTSYLERDEVCSYPKSSCTPVPCVQSIDAWEDVPGTSCSIDTLPNACATDPAYGLQQEQKLVSIPAMHGGTCNLDTRNTKRCTYMGCDPVPCVQTETTAPECLEIPGETCGVYGHTNHEKGYQILTRTTTVERMHGGTRCEPDTEDVYGCSYNNCDPVDCVLNPYPAWNTETPTCEDTFACETGDNIQTREATIRIPAMHEGTCNTEDTRTCP